MCVCVCCFLSLFININVYHAIKEDDAYLFRRTDIKKKLISRQNFIFVEKKKLNERKIFSYSFDASINS